MRRGLFTRSVCFSVLLAPLAWGAARASDSGQADRATASQAGSGSHAAPILAEGDPGPGDAPPDQPAVPATPDTVKAPETPDTVKAPEAPDIVKLPEVAGRPFVTDADIIRLIAEDAAKATDADRSSLRYFILTRLYNSGEPDGALQAYRMGLAKLLNGLSTRSDAVMPVAVDPGQTVYRVDIGRLGWSRETWDAVAAADPYATAYNNAQFRSLQRELYTPVPFVDADWFVFSAARAPLYYTILDLPKTKAELERRLGLDSYRDFESRHVARAGFQLSGESRNNRMIERHSIGTGAYWETYSFASNSDRRNVFAYPLGPKGGFGAMSDRYGFLHDEGQVVFSLPNGFHAYYATDAQGTRIDVESTRVVVDPAQRDLAVTAGISCMGCHDKGIKSNERRPGQPLDQVRDLVDRSGSFPFEVKNAVDQIFPTGDAMRKTMEGDAKRYAGALEAAGVDVDAKLEGVEVVNALSRRFEDNVTPRLAAAAFGLTEQAFMDRLGQAGREAFDLKLRLQQDSVPRDQFASLYGVLLDKISDNGDKAIRLHVREAAPMAPVMKQGPDYRAPAVRPAGKYMK